MIMKLNGSHSACRKNLYLRVEIALAHVFGGLIHAQKQMSGLPCHHLSARTNGERNRSVTLSNASH
jgi:hypothetical protein